MRWIGWNESVRLGGLSTMIGMAAIPLVIATLMLLWSWRLSIRRLLIAVTFIAIFFATIAVPYQRFWAERQASFALQADTVRTETYEKHVREYDSMQSRFPFERPAPGIYFSESALETIAWLQPSLRKLRIDREICGVGIESDQQLFVLLAQANKLPNLRVIRFGEGVTNAGRELFSESASSFPSLLSVSFSDSVDFQVESIQKLRGIKYLSIVGNPFQPRAFPSRFAKIAAELGKLVSVGAQGFVVSSAELQKWEEVDTEFLGFWATKSALTRSDLCRFSIVSPNIQLMVYPIPNR